MHTTHAVLALSLSFATLACGVDTAPPTPVGDVGDTTGAELSKGTCNLAREDIIANAQGARATAIERGFSWYDQQVTYNQQGSHEGYRTDCSGFVSMCWELGSSYTTANFIDDTSEWSSLGSFSELLPADAMVHRTGTNGHIVMFLGWNDSAQTEACVLEEAGKAEDMEFRYRTVASLESGGYHAIRATKFSGGSADSPADPGTGSGDPADPGAGSGSGSGSQCYCDAQCTEYGDCCTDCGSGSGSGSGSDPEPTPQCYCDAACSDYGDCCAQCP